MPRALLDGGLHLLAHRQLRVDVQRHAEAHAQLPGLLHGLVGVQHSLPAGHAGLVQHDHIGVSLDDDRYAVVADRISAATIMGAERVPEWLD